MVELRGPITAGEPMSGHVSWRAGGAAARAFFPADLDDLANFLGAVRHDEPLLLVGLGSNLLVRDGGFDGTAVFTHGALDTLRREEDGSFFAEAGVASPKLARFRRQTGLCRGRVPGGDSRHGGRCAGDECRLPRRRDLALRGTRADAEPARRTDHPQPGRVRRRLPPRRA
jgi:hypothetical protein